MTKKIGIMQPYVFPYLGYFQLISAVDVFVLSDDLQYIHQGWVNRNRILINGNAAYVHFPLKKASHRLNINQRLISDDFSSCSKKLLRGIRQAYAKAPHFNAVFPFIESVIHYPERNLARFAENSIRSVCGYLEIGTRIVVSSQLPVDPGLRAQERVIETVKALGGDVYINPIGGVGLYDFDDFRNEGITLKFHCMDAVEYAQFGGRFVPSLSIIDVLMFNEVEKIREQLSCYSLEMESKPMLMPLSWPEVGSNARPVV